MRQIIALAPTLLAFPRINLNKERATALISYVLDIHPIVMRDIWLNVLVAPAAVAALYDNNRYPIRDVFHALSEAAEITREYGADDLARMFRSILDRSIAPQACIGIEDILLNADFVVLPNPTPSAEDQYIRNCEMEFFAYCALTKERHIGIDGQLAPYSSLDEDTAEIHGTIDTVYPDNLVPDSLRLDTKLPVVRVGRTLFDFFDAFCIWATAECAEDLHLAVLIGAYQWVRNSGDAVSWKDMVNFRIGSEFMRSLATSAADRDKEFSAQVFETCTRIIAHAPKQPLYPFRQTANVNSPARVRSRDQAKAFRTHVTSANEGIRLMFWRLQCGDVEFANVGPKRELVIEQGNEEPAFHYTL